MMHNHSSVSMFFLSGLNETTNHRVTLFCLSLLCYCVILLVNVSVIVTIILDKDLHEPMYILLCTLCMNGLYGTTGFYPKFLWDLLSPVHVISYSGCLIQALVISSFVCSEMSILAVMSYDRYVAICRPLEYHSVMTKQRVITIACFSWLTPLHIVAVKIFLTSRLKLCSPYIARLYCINGIILKLACFSAETTANNIVVWTIVIISVLNGVFIVFSYMYLIKMCIHSLESRRKFMQTCVPHLISLFFFLVNGVLDVMSVHFGSKDLPQSFQNFVTVQFLVMPPILNPLIYGFKLTRIRNRIISVITFTVN